MAKIVHQTPPGFRRVRVRNSSRITFMPEGEARIAHDRFRAQAATRPLAFVDPGREIMRHVKLGHRFFFTTDLASAFDAVTANRLRGALQWRQIPFGWITPLHFFFHEGGRGGLIQGAPSSSYLFETYCRYGGLDRALFEYCDKLGFHYSRYVDDILISSPRWLGRRVGPKIRGIVNEFGFRLNDEKTRRVDVHSEPLDVLGYVIRGTRIEPGDETMQKLHEPERDTLSSIGLFRWRRHVRSLNRRRF